MMTTQTQTFYAALAGVIVAAILIWSARSARRIWMSRVARSRDVRDDERALDAFLGAWDLSLREIATCARIGSSRLAAAMARLEESRIVNRYAQVEGGRRTWRYALTGKGREAAYALERSRIEHAR